VKAAIIYALVDPRIADPVLRIRYIGVTTVKPYIRLRRHIYETKTSKGRHYRANWIRSLLNAGVRPMIEELLHTSRDRIWEEEVRLISEYRALGCSLTNSTTGGEGLLNPSQETRAKIGLRSRGNTYRRGKPTPPEVVERLAAMRRGATFKWSHPMTEQQRQQISIASTGRKHTAETKRRIGEASRLRIRQPHTEETRKRISAAVTGQWQPKGEENKQAKLTWKIVRTIRARYQTGLVSQAKIACEFNICQQMVSLLIAGKKWVEEQRENGTPRA
jgi:hypothetical protein